MLSKEEMKAHLGKSKRAVAALALEMGKPTFTYRIPCPKCGGSVYQTSRRDCAHCHKVNRRKGVAGREDLVIKLYVDDKMSVKAVAKEIGTTAPAVNLFLTESGLLRKPNEYRNPETRFKPKGNGRIVDNVDGWNRALIAMAHHL